MQPAAPQRRLAAILAADVVGFSRLMGADEEGTLARLKTLRSARVDPAIAAHRGRIFKTTGDGLLAEFPSVVDAVKCAAEVQRAQLDAHRDEARLVLRIGVNLGDVILEGEDLYGDGVNVAARLEGVCEPGGVALSASAYEQVRDKLPLRFVDRGEHSVKNIARPVRVWGIDFGAKLPAPRRKPRRRAALAAAIVLALAAAAGLAPRIAERLRTAPEAQAATLAVLPFANQSGDAAREYFSDGVTEDIIHALGRFSGVRVIAHHAVQGYKGRSPEDVHRELGVRYLVQGSVREADGRVRVGVALSDALRGTQLWAERYEGEGKDLFAIQDRIVKAIVGALAVKLTKLEEQRALAKPPQSLQAYDLVLRARARLARLERGANREARALLAQALEMAPDYGEAHVALAEAEFQRAGFGWIEDPAEGVRRAEAAARRALALDDPGARARAHALLGAVHAFTGRFDAALAEASRAVELNPSDTYAQALRGDALLWIGRLDEAIAALETARRYDPLLKPEFNFDLSLAYLVGGREREALALSDAALARVPDDPFQHAVRAAALARLGRLEEARAAVAQVRRYSPFLKASDFGARFMDPALRARAQQPLRLAGLP